MDDKTNLDELFDIMEEQIDPIVEYEEVEKTKVQLHKNGQVNIDAVYDELGCLITTGKKILESAEYLVDSNQDSEAIAGAATMIGTIKDTIKEFNRLYLDNVKFERQCLLEKIKHEHKKEIVKLKSANVKDDDESSEEMVPFNQEDIIKILSNKHSNNNN